MTSVLYDEPGPRARRRALIGTIIALLAIAALLFVAVRRLDEQGQFDWELWGPLLDPGFDEFPLVWELIGKGLVATLVAAVLSIALSLVIGTALGVTRMMLGRWGRIPLIAAIELFRGLPVVITIVLVWRAIVEFDINITFLPGEDGLWYLVIGLVLYNSVIIAEIVRAGVASLPKGQGEAATAVGMTRGQSMRTVLLPQAFRVMLPALISQLVVVLKDTSLAAVAGGFYIELLRRGNLIALNLDNELQVLFVVGLIFIAINFALSRLAVWVENRLGRAKVAGGASAAAQVDEVVPAG